MKKMLIGHRGNRNDFPENTLPAFESALRLPVDAIEFDVHPTRDGELVITHDDTLERCSNGAGPVRDLTFRELRALDFGSWKSPEFAGVKIPTLQEVLDLVNAVRPDIFLCVEIKEKDFGCARKIVEVLEKYRRLDNCSIISFHPEMLYFVKGMRPDVFAHGFISADEIEQPGKQDYLKLVSRIGVWYENVTESMVKNLHARNISVDCWGVNSDQIVDELAAKGVDTFTTDCPAIVEKHYHAISFPAL